ncbi:SKP1-like protein 4 [Apostasia shenzhenica]|uniref:SKP1-like protein n=1 Tax=Apostasia shenzhenica TaxID=1088818 RepID=A0A2H9ZXG1_9ASPA|nr:SKP1-like protein 4 [Apostasia shenzhenica]
MAAAGDGEEASMKMKKMTLRASDGEKVTVEMAAAMKSEVLRSMIEEGIVSQAEIPIPNVTSSILSMIFLYCEKHLHHEDPNEEHRDLAVFDAEFLNVDESVLYHLLLGANYLEVKGLLELILEKLASMIRGKSVEEIREIFKIENDYTPEEEAEFRKEHQWAF